MNSNTVLKIVTGTPLEIWAILGYLLYIGFKATQPRTVYLPSLFIVPLILTGIKSLYLPSMQVPYYFAAWLLGLVIGKLSAYSTPITVFKNSWSIELPGSYTTLVVLLSFFTVKYVFGFLNVTHPEVALEYSSIESIITGLLSGYLLGRVLGYLSRFYKTRFY
jgi:hypothetical protein